MAISASALLLCDGMSENPDTRNVSVIGIFTTLRVSKLPSPDRRFGVYALLRGQPDESAELELAIRRPAETDFEVLVSGTATIGALGARHVMIHVVEIRFGTTGLHTFSLRCNGCEIANCGLQVMLSHEFN